MIQLSYNISYSLASIVIGAVLLLIISLNYSSTNLLSKRFKYFLISALAMYILDVGTVFSNDYAEKVPTWINMAFNGLYFFSGSVVAILFLYYTVSIALHDTSPQKRRIIYLVNLILLCINFILLFVNNFTGFFFYFNEQAVYSHGPAYLFVNALSIVYTLESAVIFIIKRKKFKIRQIISTTLFYALFFGSFMVQLFVFPNILLSDFGVAIGSFIIFFSIETPDYVKLMATLQELNDLKGSLEIQVKDRTDELVAEKESYEKLTLETLSSLARVIDAKDHYTVGHSFRVAAYAKGMADVLGFSRDRSEQLYFAGLIHDVGKIGISEGILTKPGKLNDKEFEIIKSHSSIGGDILAGIHEFPIFASVARHHHERFDGTGYPDKLKGSSIPYEARIVAICDSFDAMTSDRSYRKALSDEVAIKELIDGKGTQFDPALVETFLSLYNSFSDSIRNHVDDIAAEVN